MVDLRHLLFTYIGIVGIYSFDDPKAGVKVDNFATEIFVEKKSRVVLDCSIHTSSTDIVYSWTKDGQPIIPRAELPQRKRNNRTGVEPLGRLNIAQNGSLIIERVVNKKRKQKNDEGFYECFGENGDLGTVMGRRVYLKIRRPAFTIVPQDLTKSVGGVARFHCQDNINSVLYVWHPYQIEDSRIISFTGILQISNLTLEDTGDYICQAFPRLDQPLERILENTVSLTVNTDPLPTTPVFLNTSQNVRVKQGYPALLECLAEGQGSLKTNWLKDGEPLTEDNKRVMVVGQSNVKFTRTNASDTGEYTCVLETDRETLKRHYHLEVLVPPRIIKAPPPVSNKLLVQRTRWFCIAEGHPEPRITWYMDGLKLYPAPTIQLKNELVLNGQQSDSGYYQCLAENEAGIDVATAYVEFNRKPGTPDRPRNVKAIPISSTEVNVTWTSVVTQGGFDVMAYGVDFHEVHELPCNGKCAHFFDRKRDVSNSNFKIIGNLKPYTVYSFAVQGYSGNGAGLLSGEVIVRTLEAVPSTVPDVQVAADTRTSIRVKWAEIPIEYRHGIINRYKLWHGTREKMTVLELDGDTRSYLVTGLEPDTDYRVRVVAGNSAGYPDKQLWVEYRTPPALPKVFPPPELEFESQNCTSVVLRWNCKTFGTAAVLVRITWQKLLESGTVNEIEIPVTMCEYLLTNLENGTFYKIELMVRNQDDTVTGPVIELYQSFGPGRTQQPPPPLDVDLKLLTSSTLTLEWEKPKTTMKITKYTIMYRQQSDENALYQLESPTSSVYLEGLAAFTWYVIAIKSHTESSEGPFSKPVIVQTKEGVPSPPENLQAEVVSPGTVKLQWGPPRRQNGILRFYIIYYNVDKDQPDQVWMSIQQNASTTTVIVQDLKSKVYYFKLRACTNAGEGLSSHIVAIDTLACGEKPCTPCYPPQNCSRRQTDSPEEVVTSIVQQKLGILIGCAVGLTCIIFCIIFVIRYRRVSVRGQPAVNLISNSYSDDGRRYLDQSSRNENGGYVRYVPMVRPLEENKNSDSKGADYVFLNERGLPTDKVTPRSDLEPVCVYVPTKVQLAAKCPISDDSDVVREADRQPNEAVDANETSAFLLPRAKQADDLQSKSKENKLQNQSNEDDPQNQGNENNPQNQGNEEELQNHVCEEVKDRRSGGEGLKHTLVDAQQHIETEDCANASGDELGHDATNTSEENLNDIGQHFVQDVHEAKQVNELDVGAISGGRDGKHTAGYAEDEGEGTGWVKPGSRFKNFRSGEKCNDSYPGLATLKDNDEKEAYVKTKDVSDERKKYAKEKQANSDKIIDTGREFDNDNYDIQANNMLEDVNKSQNVSLTTHEVDTTGKLKNISESRVANLSGQTLT